MKWILTGLLWMLTCWSFAQQTNSTLPPFKRYPTLPPLELTLVNSQVLTTAALKKEPTLVMYFSPTCDHCIRQMKEMKQRMDSFRHLQVVMVTYQPLEELAAFVKEYDLERYPNFIIGRDGKFLLPPFFKIQSMPFFALYNKKGALITTYEGNTTVDKLLQSFRKK